MCALLSNRKYFPISLTRRWLYTVPVAAVAVVSVFVICYCIIIIISFFFDCMSFGLYKYKHVYKQYFPPPSLPRWITYSLQSLSIPHAKWKMTQKHSFSHSVWIFTAYFFLSLHVMALYHPLSPVRTLPPLTFINHLLPFSHCVRVCTICCVSKSIGCDSYHNTSTFTTLKAIFIHIIFGKMHTSSRLAPCIWCNGETWNWNVSFNWMQSLCNEWTRSIEVRGEWKRSAQWSGS